MPNLDAKQCPHEYAGHCESPQCNNCGFNSEKSDMPDPNEILDISDYPIPDGVCPELERKCTWAINGSCTLTHKFQCPEWQDTHDH